MTKNKPDYYNNLDKIYSKIWNLLNIGLLNRNLPFHIPVFICGINNKSDGRIVVLRGVDEKQKKLWFHSDIRSNKIKILKSNPEGTLLFYDKSEKIQIKHLGSSWGCEGAKMKLKQNWGVGCEGAKKKKRFRREINDSMIFVVWTMIFYGFYGLDHGFSCF